MKKEELRKAYELIGEIENKKIELLNMLCGASVLNNGDKLSLDYVNNQEETQEIMAICSLNMLISTYVRDSIPELKNYTIMTEVISNIINEENIKKDFDTFKNAFEETRKVCSTSYSFPEFYSVILRSNIENMTELLNIKASSEALRREKTI